MISSERPFLIRKAVPADCDAVAELHIVSMQETYRAFLSKNYLQDEMPAERRKKWRERFAALDGSRWSVHVAYAVDGELAGFVCLVFSPDDEHGTLIDNLHVASRQRGSGLGRRLLAAAVADLPWERRATPMHLLVYEDNHRAVAVYDRLNGRVVGTETRIDRSKSLRMLRYAWGRPADLLRSASARLAAG